MSYTDQGSKLFGKPIGMKEMSVLAGVSLPTLFRLKKNGKLPHHRIGGRIIFLPADVEDFFASCAVPTSGKGEN